MLSPIDKVMNLGMILIPLSVSLLRLVPSVAQVTTISEILLGLDITMINLLQLQLQMH